MIGSFVPPIVSLQERIDKSVTKVAQEVVDKLADFDTDIVLAIALIADGLCRANILSREGLIAQFQRAHEARLAEWKNGHSPLSTLADYLHQAAEETPTSSSGKHAPDWLHLIEGGLSQKKSPYDKPEDSTRG